MDKINILLVDDEALIREGLHSLLEKEPFVGEIFEASDADEFKTQISKCKIDIILLDIRFRNTTGIELLEILKSSDPQPKVIAVTGMEGVELIINLLKAGWMGLFTSWMDMKRFGKQSKVFWLQEIIFRRKFCGSFNPMLPDGITYLLLL